MLTTTHKNIAHVKAVLKIQPINTGKVFNYHGIVFDDLEGLHAIKSIDGNCLNLVSGLEMYYSEYRGQTQEYAVCFSSLDRISDTADLFLALCRSIYFQKALEFHPMVQFLQNKAPVLDGVDELLPICVNLEAIAQHYNLCTDYLDITSSFSVASFFATQKWDPVEKKFQPMRGSEHVGVIYKIATPLIMSDPAYGDDIPYIPVGWQPFPRPEEQRANAIKLKVGQDFANSELPVTAYRFRHSYRRSKEIYERFEGGNKLMPEDNLADFAESVEIKNSFPQTVINEAANKTCQRKGIVNSKEKQEQLAHIAGVTTESEGFLKQYPWPLSEEQISAKMAAVIGRVRYRRVRYLEE